MRWRVFAGARGVCADEWRHAVSRPRGVLVAFWVMYYSRAALIVKFSSDAVRLCADSA